MTATRRNRHARTCATEARQGLAHACQHSEGRSNDKVGEPFRAGEAGAVRTDQGQIVRDKRHAYLLYRSLAPLNPKLVAEAQTELAGKNLACWCGKDDPYEDACHAAVLLELANKTAEQLQKDTP